MWVEINISQAGCAGNLLHYHPLKVSSPLGAILSSVQALRTANLESLKREKIFWLRLWTGGDKFELFALLGN